MKVKLIATVSDPQHTGWKHLQRSLDYFGWDYEPLVERYDAYGSKMVNAYNYAKRTDCTHLFIVDGYDVFVLGTMEEALSRIPYKDIIMFNAERACWPYEQWAMLYPEGNSIWQYLNGGVAFVEVEKFIKMYEDHPIDHVDNDQVNLAKIYITEREKYNMTLDYRCKVFQSISHHNGTEFDITGQVFTNKIHDTRPILVHGNGHTDMTQIYNML